MNPVTPPLEGPNYAYEEINPVTPPLEGPHYAHERKNPATLHCWKGLIDDARFIPGPSSGLRGRDKSGVINEALTGWEMTGLKS